MRRDASLLQSAAATTTSLLQLQLFSRLLTFLLNSLLLRFVAPEILGMTAVRMDMMISTVFFLSRNGARMASLRRSTAEWPRSQRQWTKTIADINLLCGLVAIGVSGCFMAWLFWWPPREIVELEAGHWQRYVLAVVIYALSAFLELFYEPIYAMCTINHKHRARLLVEAVSLLLKSATCTVLVFWAANTGRLNISNGMLLFACSQMANSLAMLSGYVAVYYQNNRFDTDLGLRYLLPSFPLSFDQNLLTLTYDLTLQSFLSYLLSQGDMLVVSMFTELRDQGVYATVTNYGSLVVRLLLQPVEESSLQFFCKALANFPIDRLNENHPTLEDISAFNTAMHYFRTVLKFLWLLSLCFMLFGTTNADLVVSLFLGPRWHSTELPRALSVYCLHIAALAATGILETFMHATISRDWIKRTRKSTIIFSMAYIPMAILGIRWYGVIGLLLANLLNFTMRAIQGMYYYQHYAKAMRSIVTSNASKARLSPIKLHDTIPNPRWIVSLLVLAILCQFSSQVSTRAISGLACFGAVIAITHLFESELVADVREIMHVKPH